jgi:hypothetical protein
MIERVDVDKVASAMDLAVKVNEVVDFINKVTAEWPTEAGGDPDPVGPPNPEPEPALNPETANAPAPGVAEPEVAPEP